MRGRSRFRNIRTWGLFLLLLLMTLTACKKNGEEHSPLFYSIFKIDDQTFRGMELGDQLETVQNRETGSLVHNDERGLVYNVNLGESREMVVEYFKDPKAKGRRINQLMGVNADVELRDEVEAIRLYEEIAEHFSVHYGFAEGQSGDNTWNSPEDSLETNLRLSDNKKGLSFYYVWMDSENQ